MQASLSTEKHQQARPQVPSSPFLLPTQPQAASYLAQGSSSGASGSSQPFSSNSFQYSTPVVVPPEYSNSSARSAAHQGPVIALPVASTSAARQGVGNGANGAQTQAAVVQQASASIGSISGTHILNDESTFRIAVGETYHGRRVLQKKIQEIALRNNFRVNIGRSSVVTSPGPCPVNGSFMLQCYLDNGPHSRVKRQGQPPCPFAMDFSFVLERNGTDDNQLDFKLKSIVDQHNHALLPLSQQEIKYASRTPQVRIVSLRDRSGRKSGRDQSSDESGSDYDDEKEKSRARSSLSRRKAGRRSVATAASFEPKDCATVDWIPSNEWNQPLTGRQILGEFPRVAYQATGIEIFTSDTSGDLTFRCKLHKETQCDWTAVFAKVLNNPQVDEIRFQLLGPGPKRTFAHSHPIEELESSSTVQSSLDTSIGSSRQLEARQEIETPASSTSNEPRVSPMIGAEGPGRIAAHSPRNCNSCAGFAESGSPEDVKPILVESSKRARPVSPGAAAVAGPSVNLGFMILEDSDDDEQREKDQAKDVKPDLAAISGEHRPAKQARINESPAFDNSTASSSTDTHSRPSLTPASTTTTTPLGLPIETTTANTSTAQRELEAFLLSIDPNFIVLTSTGQKLNLNFLAPLLLADESLPDTIEELGCLQSQDAQLLAKPLQEAYEKGGETWGKIKGFDWTRIVNRLEGWLKEK
ncbi:hypothetical protein JCM5350_008064 [Sporobolomyces pararoseus]